MTSEFSRIIDIRDMSGKTHELVATQQECAALAKRFSIVSLDSFMAHLVLEKDGATIFARGEISAELQQLCSVTAEEFPAIMSDDIEIRFEPETEKSEEVTPDEEIELTEQDFDVEYYTGDKIDIGEAAAQSLAVAIDPYPRGPHADSADARANISTPEDNSPFAALKNLKK
ncbi:YceD family protein [Sphingorhabdus sp. Alg239-R122]|uniref:YceD family protein n=1 Tax=Sphingorhabdus sp. Alg239-R122 TaxID=2305989 RepID=UPI0013DBF34B|nr:YceD family protein [Sphingorhabdus sp. Alg239-R122]